MIAVISIFVALAQCWFWFWIYHTVPTDTWYAFPLGLTVFVCFLFNILFFLTVGLEN